MTLNLTIKELHVVIEKATITMPPDDSDDAALVGRLKKMGVTVNQATEDLKAVVEEHKGE